MLSPGAKSDGFVDDRGRPLQVASQDVIIDHTGSRRAYGMLVVMWVGIGLVVMWGVVDFVRHPAAPSVGQLLVMIPILLVGPLAQRFTKASRRPPPLSALAAELAAHR